MPTYSHRVSNKRILVVDDDLETLTLLRWALDDEGFSIDTAVDGKQALDLLDGGQPYGLVLLDLSMPVMSGWQVLEMLTGC